MLGNLITELSTQHGLTKDFTFFTNERMNETEKQLIWQQKERAFFIISWNEKGFRDCDIKFFLEPEVDKSLIRGLNFYLKSSKTEQAHIMFKNYDNFMEFFSIIVVGGLRKIW